MSKKISEDKEYVEPTENDILRGRGGRINAHPGKQRLLDLVRAQGQRYAVLKRGQKGRMGQEIVDMVHAWGGRFLEMEKDSDGFERYFVLDQRASIKLVEQKFRDDPTKRKPKTTNNQSKKAVKELRKRAYEQVSAAIPKNHAIAEHVDDEDDALVEMELRQDIFASPHSRQVIAAQVNQALTNLERTAPEDDQRYHCVSPTNSFDEQLRMEPSELEQAFAYDEVSSSDSSSYWSNTLDVDPFLDPTAFFTDDANELVDEMYHSDLLELENL